MQNHLLSFPLTTSSIEKFLPVETSLRDDILHQQVNLRVDFKHDYVRFGQPDNTDSTVYLYL